jgi:hypothetical protein
MAKNAIKKHRRENTTGKSYFFSTFWQKVFDMNFPQTVFNGVFELPLLRNAQKRHRKKVTKKKGKVPTYPIKWLSARYTSLPFFPP